MTASAMPDLNTTTLFKDFLVSSPSLFSELFLSLSNFIALIYTLLFEQFQLIVQGLENFLADYVLQIGLGFIFLAMLSVVFPWLFWKIIAILYGTLAMIIALFNPMPHVAFAIGIYDSLMSAWIEPESVLDPMTH